MKLIKVIPLIYIPFGQEQGLYYFSKKRNLEKYYPVFIPVRNKKTIGIISSIIDFDKAKIFIRKIADYPLKPIEKIIFYKKIINDKNLKLIDITENIYLQPKTLIFHYFFPKFLFEKQKSKKKIKHNLFFDENSIEDYNKRIENSLNEIINEINVNLSKNKNIIILFPQLSSLFFYYPFFEKYFKGKIELFLRCYPDNFKHIFENINSIKGRIIFSLKDALFYPFKNVRVLILMDEENSNYEKKLEFPKFDTRKIAVLYSKIFNNIKILKKNLLFPKIEDFDNSFKKIEKIKLEKFKYFITKKDISYNETDPFLEICNIIKKKKEIKVLVLQNRKGFSVFLKCIDCSYIFYCKNCDIPLKFYKTKKILKCHYCGNTQNIPETCPNCYGYNLKIIGTGIEKIETFFKEALLDIKNLEFFKIDLDEFKTPLRKINIIKKINSTKKAIVIGTNSLLDLRFKKFDISFIPNIDLFFNFPGYDRIEDILYILGFLNNISSKVFINSFGQESELIKKLKENKFIDLYKEELNFRKKFLWPPFVDLLKITIAFKDKQKAKIRALIERNRIDYLLEKYRILGKVKIYGPNEDFIFKRKNKYHYVIILKFPKNLRNLRNNIIKKINPEFKIEVKL